MALVFMLVQVTAWMASTLTAQNYYGDGDDYGSSFQGPHIYFPEQPQVPAFLLRKSHVNCSGNSSNPCDEDAEYNQDIKSLFDSILQHSPLSRLTDDANLNSIFVDPNLKHVLSPPVQRPSVVSTRFGGNAFTTENPACKAEESIIYPKRAKTVDDDWVFVLNQGKVQQGIKVEKCINEGSKCDIGASLPETIQTTCRQKYIYRKMLVMGSQGDKIMPESVYMPSCCICYITKVEFNIDSRKQLPPQDGSMPTAQDTVYSSTRFSTVDNSARFSAVENHARFTTVDNSARFSRITREYRPLNVTQNNTQDLGV